VFRLDAAAQAVSPAPVKAVKPAAPVKRVVAPQPVQIARPAARKEPVATAADWEEF